MKKALEKNGDNGCKTIWMYLMPLNLKMVKTANFMWCAFHHNFKKWSRKKIFLRYMLKLGEKRKSNILAQRLGLGGILSWYIIEHRANFFPLQRLTIF